MREGIYITKDRVANQWYKVIQVSTDAAAIRSFTQAMKDVTFDHRDFALYRLAMIDTDTCKLYPEDFPVEITFDLPGVDA